MYALRITYARNNKYAVFLFNVVGRMATHSVYKRYGYGGVHVDRRNYRGGGGGSVPNCCLPWSFHGGRGDVISVREELE